MAPRNFMSASCVWPSSSCNWAKLTSVTHSSSRGSRDTSNEADDGLVGSVVLLEEVCSVLFGGTTNLANHDDSVSLAVLEEDLEAVDEVCAREGVTTNTDDKRLTETGLGGLVDGLVGKSAGAGDDADATALVDETRHDANLTLALLARIRKSKTCSRSE